MQPDETTQPDPVTDDRSGEPGDPRPVDEAAAGDAAADELAQMRRERDETRDRWLRAVAELDNFRKRTRKEMEDIRVHAVAGLLRDLLEVLDNFERAAVSLGDSGGGEGELEGLRNGVALIHQRFRDVLMAQGLERIEASGEEFDPALHEAILEMEKEGVAPGRVAEVVQPGYRLRDLVIRPSRVIVAK